MNNKNGQFQVVASNEQ